MLWVRAQYFQWLLVNMDVYHATQVLSTAEFLIDEILTGATGIREELQLLQRYTHVLAKGLHEWNNKFDNRKDAVSLILWDSSTISLGLAWSSATAYTVCLKYQICTACAMRGSIVPKSPIVINWRVIVQARKSAA